jgi:hypothetical protein
MHAPAAQTRSLAVWCFVAATLQKNTTQPIVSGNATSAVLAASGAYLKGIDVTFALT